MSETKSKVDERREAARGFAEHLRKVYGRAYEYAISTGREGLDDLVRAGRSVEPAIRKTIDERVHLVQEAFDDLNKSLAQKAIPGFRRQNISLSDELK